MIKLYEPVHGVEPVQLCIVSLVVRQGNNIKTQDLCRYTWTKMATVNIHSEVKGEWKSVNITSEMEVRAQTACGPYIYTFLHVVHNNHNCDCFECSL